MMTTCSFVLRLSLAPCRSEHPAGSVLIVRRTPSRAEQGRAIKRRIMAILGLGILLGVGATASQAEWRMRVHGGALVTEFTLSEVDSVTFLDEEMILIPAGTFTMGSPTNEPGRSAGETQHQVTLTKAFYLSRCEVTQAEWQDVMGWNESAFPGLSRPVERVTWYDAVSYCNQLSARDGYTPAYAITSATHDGNHVTSATVSWNQAVDGYRLLTEAEWEYVCRAGSATAFCNGGITVSGYNCSPLDPNLDIVGWYCGNDGGMTHDAGGKTWNAWGLQDMHGNVSEWCWDWFGGYSTDPVTDPIGPSSGTTRVPRGGNWTSKAYSCRSADRHGTGPSGWFYEIGLRVARTAQ